MDRLSLMTPEEFEHAQLKADMVFCRRCGVVDNVATPMLHDGSHYLDESMGPRAAGRFHVYRCPRCNHRAMSEAHS